MQTGNHSKIKTTLGSRKWRLDNLYKIVDKEGKIVPFKMNWAQKALLENLWYMNIILKARQLGMSTFIELFILDACLFNPNKKAGIIADTLDSAKKLLRDKIKFAYEHLPPEIKEAVPMIKNDAEEVLFDNGSGVIVGTSHRGGTLQILHISEHAKICAKAPIKAKEIKTGALNTVQAGQLIFIESTAEGSEGDFHDICVRAEQNQDELSKLDFSFNFFPWYEHPDYILPYKGKPFSSAMSRYFETIPVKLSNEQKQWYIAKAEQQGDSIKQEYPSTSKEAFEVSLENRIYNREVQVAETENRVTSVPIAVGIPVDTYWDLGRADNTSIIFVQQVGKEIRIVDFYENNGEHIMHYVQVLKEKGYLYGKCFLPHDAKNDLLSAEKNIYTHIKDSGLTPRIVDKVSIEQGISEVRILFPRFWFDKAKCQPLIEHLRNYKKKWNETLGVYAGQVHDSHSHASDAIRYLAVEVDKVSQNSNDILLAQQQRTTDILSDQSGNPSFWDSDLLNAQAQRTLRLAQS